MMLSIQTELKDRKRLFRPEHLPIPIDHSDLKHQSYKYSFLQEFEAIKQSLSEVVKIKQDIVMQLRHDVVI